MNTRPILIVIAALVVLFLAYLAFSAANKETEPMNRTATTTTSAATTTVATTSAPTTNNGGNNVPGAPAGNTTTTKSVTITYGPNGFSSSNVSVPVGSTVTWVNEGSGRMWVATARHPDHTVYDGTSTAEHCANNGPTSAAVFDQCTASARYSFTFTKAGTFNYHNHSNASHFGSVTVTAR